MRRTTRISPRNEEGASELLARRRIATTGTALSALLLTTVFASAPAYADPDPTPALAPAGATDTIDKYIDENQNKLMDLKSWIINQPGLSDSGYIESVNDSSKLSMTLLWSGPGNSLQKSIIAEGAKRGITVTVRDRKFTRKQLNDAAEAIASTSSATLSGFDWEAVSAINADFDGVSVVGKNATPIAGEGTALRKAKAERLTAVAKKATTVGGVDVKIAGDDLTVQTMAATRWNDTSAYNAGGWMHSPTQGGCSTGFSLNVNGTPSVMTARHCMAHDYKTLTGGRSYGDGVRNSTDGGARQMSAKGSRLMFDGAWNNAAGYKKTVIGFGDVSIGDAVCTSGANSGVHCGVVIRDLDVWFDDEYPHVADSRFMTIFGVANSGAAACPGDSGGPVLTPRNTADVLAVGMIQGGPVDRPGTNPPVWTISASTRTGTLCSRGVYFTAMRTIARTLPNASLVTS
jgi:hypothetical protein